MISTYDRVVTRTMAETGINVLTVSFQVKFMSSYLSSEKDFVLEVFRSAGAAILNFIIIECAHGDSD